MLMHVIQCSISYKHVFCFFCKNKKKIEKTKTKTRKKTRNLFDSKKQKKNTVESTK